MERIKLLEREYIREKEKERLNLGLSSHSDSPIKMTKPLISKK